MSEIEKQNQEENNKLANADVIASKASESEDTDSGESGQTGAGSVSLKKPKFKGKVRHSSGNVYILATFGNTIITISTRSGDVLLQKSAGAMGFKGSRKGTPFAAQQAAEVAAREAIDRFGMKRVNVYLSGPGAGREQALRSLHNKGLTVELIEDTTSIPHNGCRPRKKRRV